MSDKKMLTVFILDTDNLSGIMDAAGNKENFPMLHGYGCVYEDHPEIGKKLMLPTGKDGVFQAEDMVNAINNYKKHEPKKDNKSGEYDTKVMTKKTKSKTSKTSKKQNN